MEFPEHFHVTIKTEEQLKIALAFFHKQGYTWFDGLSLEGSKRSKQAWRYFCHVQYPLVYLVNSSLPLKGINMHFMVKVNSVDITHIVLPPLMTPEQVLVMFLKHHRKFTAFKTYLKNHTTLHHHTSANFPLEHVFDDPDPRAFNYLKESFQGLLYKFNLQDSHIDLVTLVKMR
jgi:hypothetical protein